VRDAEAEFSGGTERGKSVQRRNPYASSLKRKEEVGNSVALALLDFPR
jgi:hypothetical protein